MKENETISWQVKLEETAQRVKIQICNGGDPIPPEVLPKLTKPFYTTKPSGTGLGLSIVQRIVDAHSGEFAKVAKRTAFGIASSAAEGTLVSVQLPVANCII